MTRVLIFCAMAVALLTGCSGASKPKLGAPTAQAVSDASPTGPVSPTATSVETLDALPLQPLTLGEDIPLPDGVVVYYFNTGYGKGGGPGVLQRAYRDRAGRLRVDLLSEPLKSFGPLVWAAADVDHGLVAAIVCVHPVCGAGESMSSADSLLKLLTSDDGGVSWNDRGEVPPDTFVYGVAPGVLLLATRPFFQAERYWSFPSGDAITPPAPDFSPTFIQGLGPVWMRELAWGREVVDWSGATLPSTGAQFPDARFVASAIGAQAALRTVWFTRGITRAGTELISRSVLAILDDKRSPTAAFGWDGADIRFTTLISPTVVLGNVSKPAESGQRLSAALIDLESRTIHPVPELNPANGSTPFIHAALVGSFARVKSGGDCLNVRENPSQSSLALGCFKDGVLLRVRPEPEQTVDGTTWLAVETPDGRAGWASAEFLER